jgi:hypothetical protein
MRRLGWAVLGLLAACGEEATPTPAPRAAEPDAAMTAPAECQPPPVPVVVTDAWGGPLGSSRVVIAGDARNEAPLAAPGSVPLVVESEDHLGISGALRWSGDATREALVVEGARFWAASVALEPVETLVCPRFTVFVGLEHRWFSPEARPWHDGNEAHAYDQPDAVWADVAAGVSAAREEVLWYTWWWQSDTQLVRGQPIETPTEALLADTALGRIGALPDSVRRRILVNYFLDFEGAFFLTTDEALREFAEAHTDAIEVMGQANAEAVPALDEYAGRGRPVDFLARLRVRDEWAEHDFGPAIRADAMAAIEAASYHMKGVVVDGAVAWVMGLNTQPSYWDAAPHAVFDVRRMPVTATLEERQAVRARRVMPDYGPYRDYAVRLRGPVVSEMAGYFGQMWARAQSEGEIYSEDTSPYEVPVPGARAGASKVQIQVTMPPPEAEQSILDGQLRAIRQARHFILIEDQYWRATRLLDALVQALEKNPELVLIVATNEVGENDGGKKWTLHMDARLREVAADRYLLLQLRTTDVQTGMERGNGRARVLDLEVYIHSKMMIVDDTYVSIGSANKNNRSLLYDGEMNTAIVDPVVARGLRDRVLASWVGANRADRLGDDMAANRAVLAQVAQENALIVEAWHTRLPHMSDGDIAAEAAIRPNGLVFVYVPEGEYALDPGPDFF